MVNGAVAPGRHHTLPIPLLKPRSINPHTQLFLFRKKRGIVALKNLHWRLRLTTLTSEPVTFEI